MLKTRCFPDKNYKGIYFNGKTIRIALDETKPILELDYPEFYDVKITGKCSGKCPYCYMDSKETDYHYENIIDKVISFFGRMTLNERCFQVAIGGGEPTQHPDFCELLKTFHKMGITPNYTTNGMFIDDPRKMEIIHATQLYSGGVAVSCHDHLKYYWGKAADLLYINRIKLNFHIIISDRKSIDDFMEIFRNWYDKVDYFVLLPYGVQGRADNKEIDWEYFIKMLPNDISKLAFGANFYSNLVEDAGKNIKVSLYEPESMSKFLSLEGTGSVYSSSFNLTPLKTGVF